MSGERFHLDLTGRPLEGYPTEEVATALARLLRLPRAQVRNLLRGKPSRIKKEVDKERAIRLMGKIIACGAECEMSPSEEQYEATQPVVERAGSSEKPPLELELKQPEPSPPETELAEMELVPVVTEGPSATDAESDYQSPPQADLHTPEPVAEIRPGNRVQREPTAQAGVASIVGTGTAGLSASAGGGRLRLISIATAAVAALGIAVWAGFGFLGGSKPAAPVKEMVEKPSAEAAPPKALTDVEKTRRRLELLARSVRIWMIQYGAGFDPSQVTMERMQQDLEISAEEMKDSWGELFRYTAIDNSYTVTSAGPDRVFGNEDDLKVEKSAQ